jgi:hypothetical protein
MKMHELPPANVRQELYCPDCGYCFPIPSGPGEPEHARKGGMLVLHCAHCHEVVQGRFYVPQPDIHEVNRLRGEIRRTP